MGVAKPGLMGSRIKLARNEAGLTQAALARRLGVTAGAVGQWEVLANDPQKDKWDLLADILNVSVDWLLGRQTRLEEAPRPNSEVADNSQLIEEARRLGEQAHLLGVDLKQVVAQARQRRWIEENRGALEDANAFVERHGLWSDGKRLF